MSKQYISEEKARIIMSSEQQEWQFHFRSFYQQGNMHVRVHIALLCRDTLARWPSRLLEI